MTVVILRIWWYDWEVFWTSRTPSHRGISQHWALTSWFAKLSWKCLVAGNPATLSINLFFSSLPLLFQRWMNVQKMLLQLWCSKSVWKTLRIRRFVRLQIFRVSPLHPGEVFKDGFPLLVLCSTAVGLAAGKAAFFVEREWYEVPPGKLAPWWVWGSVDVPVKIKFSLCNWRVKGFFYMIHSFTQNESLQKAHPPPAP